MPITGSKLALLAQAFTRHGNAAWLTWSDDGKTVFLANEEGIMSAVKIDVTDPAKPRITGTNGTVNYMWAAAHKNGLLVFYPSIDDELHRIDPSTFKTIWNKRLFSESHAIETDGARIFVPFEGKPGALAVLDPNGMEIGRVQQSEGWYRVYSITFDESTKRLYVGAGDNAASGFPGGVYIYDASGFPTYKGKISGPSWDIAAKGNRLWRQMGDKIEAWDVTNPAAPQLLGTWQAPVETCTACGGKQVKTELGMLRANSAGTRLYAVYRSIGASDGQQTLNWFAGFSIFDVSGNVPVRLVRQGWKLDSGNYTQPTGMALSPDESLLAVSYWAFGVRLHKVSADQVQSLGMVATTGEGHDVYVDNLGYLHVFANDDIQIVDPKTGEHVGVYITGSQLDGQWRSFKDGTVLLPSARNGSARWVLQLRDGTAKLVTTLAGPASMWDEIFEDPYLYSAGTDGKLYVQKVGAFDAATKQYPLTVLGSVNVGGFLLAIAKSGSVVWGVGPSVGVVAVDVSNPLVPKVIYQDKFAFGVNGNHAGIIVARGRVYAGVGDTSLIIYSASTFQRVKTIPGFNVNFLDSVGEDLLVVANYWYPTLPEGVYVYDLRNNPESPSLLDWFPPPKGSANFRARAIGGKVYRVPLYGVDVLQLQ